jgi:hypothetical protein
VRWHLKDFLCCLNSCNHLRIAFLNFQHFIQECLMISTDYVRRRAIVLTRPLRSRNGNRGKFRTRFFSFLQSLPNFLKKKMISDWKIETNRNFQLNNLLSFPQSCRFTIEFSPETINLFGEFSQTVCGVLCRFHDFISNTLPMPDHLFFNLKR